MPFPEAVCFPDNSPLLSLLESGGGDGGTLNSPGGALSARRDSTVTSSRSRCDSAASTASTDSGTSGRSRQMTGGMPALAETRQFSGRHMGAAQISSGLFELLDEECRTPHGKDLAFLTKAYATYEKAAAADGSLLFKEPKQDARSRRISNAHRSAAFILSHFAGDVVYQAPAFLDTRRHATPPISHPAFPPSQAPGFLDKNKESLNPDLRRLLLSSQLPLVALLVDPLDDDDGATTARGGKKKRVTVMGQFKRELGELMHVLQSSGTHFIRCIKPSPKQEPGHWDAPMVLSQLRCSGLMAAVQLMAMGYPCRATYTELFDIFSSMPGLDRLASLGPKNFCTALLMAVEVPRAQMFHGVQRVFLKAGQIGFLERLRSQGATIDQDIIEKVMRFMIRRRWRRGCAAAICALRTQKILHGIALRHRWRRVARIRLAIERKWVATAVRVRAYMRARKMQTAARGRAARESYKVARAAIVVLQRHGRGRPRRAEYGRMKVAALHLERIARGKKTRSWFKWYVERLAILRAAATTVQARARGVSGRAAAQRARETKAATAVAAERRAASCQRSRGREGCCSGTCST